MGQEMEGRWAGGPAMAPGLGPQQRGRPCAALRPCVHRPPSLSLLLPLLLRLGLALYLTLAVTLTGPQGASALSLRQLLRGAARRASTAVGSSSHKHRHRHRHSHIHSQGQGQSHSSSKSAGTAQERIAAQSKQQQQQQQQQQQRLGAPAEPYPRGVQRLRPRGGPYLGSVYLTNVQEVQEVQEAQEVEEVQEAGYEEVPKQYSTPNGLIAWPGLWGGTAGRVQFHGGRVLTDNVTVYVIFYGDWPPDSGQGVLENFILSLTEPDQSQPVGAPSLYQWWQTLYQYKQADGKGVAPKVYLGRNIYMTVPYKKQLDDGTEGGTNDIEQLVVTSIQTGRLPLDPNGVYMVLTSKDVKVGSPTSGFCGFAGYCGWHTQTSIGGVPVPYGFVGDSTAQCNDGCGHNMGLRTTPNGFYGMDSLLSTLGHEIAEAVTNPDVRTGYWALSSDGSTEWEEADVCNNVYTDNEFNTIKYGDGPYAYNMVGRGGLRFLVQANVDLDTQTCVLRLPEQARAALMQPPPPAVVVPSPPPSPPPPVFPPPSPPPPPPLPPSPLPPFPSPPLALHPPPLPPPPSPPGSPPLPPPLPPHPPPLPPVPPPSPPPPPNPPPPQPPVLLLLSSPPPPLPPLPPPPAPTPPLSPPPVSPATRRTTATGPTRSAPGAAPAAAAPPATAQAYPAAALAPAPAQGMPPGTTPPVLPVLILPSQPAPWPLGPTVGPRAVSTQAPAPAPVAGPPPNQPMPGQGPQGTPIPMPAPEPVPEGVGAPVDTYLLFPPPPSPLSPPPFSSPLFSPPLPPLPSPPPPPSSPPLVTTPFSSAPPESTSLPTPPPPQGSAAAPQPPVASSVAPTAPPALQCSAEGAACGPCTSPDGCLCKDGACVSFCIALGTFARCGSCGVGFCLCAVDGTCQSW